jgi:L-seryl-tRNA(Ser) seleniumtransferase
MLAANPQSDIRNHVPPLGSPAARRQNKAHPSSRAPETLAMAPKPLDFLNRIPTVSELLEKQPVRALTDRWNRSTVAAGVRSFLDELRTDLRRRAAEVPSIRELAERAAQYVVAMQQSAPQTVVNATGRLIGTPWASVPLADKALERAVVVGRDFVLAPAALAGTPSGRAASGVESLVCRLTGSQAAVAVHSYGGALWLTFAALASEREALVSRADATGRRVAEN